jgi:xanthine dehydrogenase accessory factor
MTILQTLATLERTGEPVAVATVVRSQGSVPRHDGSKMLIYPDGRIDGTIGGGDMESRVIKEALAALEDGETRILSYAFRDVQKGDVGVCGGEVEVFVEPLLPKPQVIIAGGGHVGKAVAHLAHWLGFRVVVTDDRADYATADAVPDADEHIHCPLSELSSKLRVDQNSYVLLTTRGMPVDVEGLPALLETNAAYIGVIGSRRRWEVCVSKLKDAGVSDDAIARITSPIGLELNAESPEEIAVSIMAEIIMLRRKGTGERMQHEP